MTVQITCTSFVICVVLFHCAVSPLYVPDAVSHCLTSTEGAAMLRYRHLQ